jgi:DHA2 family multidrug resistance protein
MAPANFLTLSVVSGELSRQSAMVAYVDSFRLLFWMTLCMFPMLLIMRKPKARTETPVVHAD